MFDERGDVDVDTKCVVYDSGTVSPPVETFGAEVTRGVVVVASVFNAWRFRVCRWATSNPLFVGHIEGAAGTSALMSSPWRSLIVKLTSK